jgi:RNA polymerase sigma-70 factor (subfamily 1)
MKRKRSSRDREGSDPGRIRENMAGIDMHLAAARKGDGKAREQLFEVCRQYLLMIANQELDEELRRKVGASDIVHDTLVTAQQGFRRFKGTCEAEMLQWVRQILVRKLANAWRYYGQTLKRDIHREQSIADLGNSMGGALLDPTPTPESRAMAQERAGMVMEVMDRLPAHYQQLLRLRSFERRTFQEIGEQLGISSEAARKAWGRAVQRFRREWNRDFEEPRPE